jgi:hypothetical protein
MMQPYVFWGRVEDYLRWYFQTGRPVAWRCSPFRERKGLLVLCEMLVLAALNGAIACSPRVAWAAIPLAVYIGFDILVANTVIVFLTGGAVSPLRSAILTLGGYFNVAQAFAAFWILLSGDKTASVRDRVLTGIYESVRVLATAGPPAESMTPGQKALAVVEMLLGIYFLVVIFAIYASWATARPVRKAGE